MLLEAVVVPGTSQSPTGPWVKGGEVLSQDSVAQWRMVGSAVGLVRGFSGSVSSAVKQLSVVSP